MLAAVPLAALFDVYYSAALPFVAAIGVVAVVTVFALRRSWPDLRMVAALALSLVAIVILALPAMSSVANSYSVTSSNFGTSATAASDLGNWPDRFHSAR